MTDESVYMAALMAAETALAGTPGQRSAFAWRHHTRASGLPGADLPLRVGGGGCSAGVMMPLFCGAGCASAAAAFYRTGQSLSAWFKLATTCASPR